MTGAEKPAPLAMKEALDTIVETVGGRQPTRRDALLEEQRRTTPPARSSRRRSRPCGEAGNHDRHDPAECGHGSPPGRLPGHDHRRDWRTAYPGGGCPACAADAPGAPREAGAAQATALAGRGGRAGRRAGPHGRDVVGVARWRVSGSFLVGLDAVVVKHYPQLPASGAGRRDRGVWSVSVSNTGQPAEGEIRCGRRGSSRG